MVRYEVELMLHLCLISKKEHDTIIKTLTFRFVLLLISVIIFISAGRHTCMFVFFHFSDYFPSCRLDQFVKEGLIENQLNLFQVKTKDESLEKENALADQSDTTLNETVYKSFCAEEPLVAEKPVENDPVTETDEDLGIKEKSFEITSEVEEVLNKSFVEVKVPSEPEVVELIEIEKEPETLKEPLGPAEDLSLVIDDDEEDDDDVVKELTNNDIEVEELTNKDKEVKEAINKTEDFELLILTDEPEPIVELKEKPGKCLEKQRGLERKGRKSRGSAEKKSENVKLDMDVRVDVARIRTRSASVKENTPKKVRDYA